MTGVDVLIIILLLAAGLSGFRRGLVRQVMSGVGLIVGIALAFSWVAPTALAYNLDSSDRTTLLTFAAIALGVWLLFKIVGAAIRWLLARMPVVRTFDAIMGAALAVVSTALLVGAMALFFDWSGVSNSASDALAHSRVASELRLVVERSLQQDLPRNPT